MRRHRRKVMGMREREGREESRRRGETCHRYECLRIKGSKELIAASDGDVSHATNPNPRTQQDPPTTGLGAHVC